MTWSSVFYNRDNPVIFISIIFIAIDNIQLLYSKSQLILYVLQLHVTKPENLNNPLLTWPELLVTWLNRHKENRALSVVWRHTNTTSCCCLPGHQRTAGRTTNTPHVQRAAPPAKQSCLSFLKALNLCFCLWEDFISCNIVLLLSCIICNNYYRYLNMTNKYITWKMASMEYHEMET